MVISIDLGKSLSLNLCSNNMRSITSSRDMKLTFFLAGLCKATDILYIFLLFPGHHENPQVKIPLY